MTGCAHEVAPGTTFCYRCGLVIKRKRRRPPGVRLRARRRRGLPHEMNELVARYGFDLVERALYESVPR